MIGAPPATSVNTPVPSATPTAHVAMIQWRCDAHKASKAARMLGRGSTSRILASGKTGATIFDQAPSLAPTSKMSGGLNPRARMSSRKLTRSPIGRRWLPGRWIRRACRPQAASRRLPSRFTAYLPFCIADRNSPFDLVLLIFESSSSMASAGESGASTLRRT